MFRRLPLQLGVIELPRHWPALNLPIVRLLLDLSKHHPQLKFMQAQLSMHLQPRQLCLCPVFIQNLSQNRQRSELEVRSKSQIHLPMNPHKPRLQHRYLGMCHIERNHPSIFSSKQINGRRLKRYEHEVPTQMPPVLLDLSIPQSSRREIQELHHSPTVNIVIKTYQLLVVRQVVCFLWRRMGPAVPDYHWGQHSPPLTMKESWKHSRIRVPRSHIKCRQVLLSHH